MNVFEKMDYIFNVIKSASYGETIETIGEIVEENSVDISSNEVRAIVLEIFTLGYTIKKGKVPEYFALSVKGLMFHGFVKEEIIKEATLNQISQEKDQIRSYQSKLLWGTWFAGIAALLVLLWQIFLYFYPVHKDYPYWIWEHVGKK